MHAVLQGPRQDPLPDPQAADDARQVGPHLQGALHPHAVPRLTETDFVSFCACRQESNADKLCKRRLIVTVILGASISEDLVCKTGILSIRQFIHSLIHDS